MMIGQQSNEYNNNKIIVIIWERALDSTLYSVWKLPGVRYWYKQVQLYLVPYNAVQPYYVPSSHDDVTRKCICWILILFDGRIFNPGNKHSFYFYNFLQP